MTSSRGSSLGHGRTIVNNVLQAAENSGLPIERQSRITDGIQEENVRGFGLGVIQRLHGCSDKAFPLLSSVLTSDLKARPRLRAALRLPSTLLDPVVTIAASDPPAFFHPC